MTKIEGIIWQRELGVYQMSAFNIMIVLFHGGTGRKSSESLTISGQTYSCATQHDAAGQVSKLIYPDTSEVTRTYTARGQLETIRLGTTTIDTRTYDDGGRMTASSYNNGVSESRSYNSDNTLATINYTGASIGNLAYTWDANKNKTAETISGVMSGYGFSAAYDAEDRLTSWTRADTTLNQSWNLSPVGNWNSITENASTQNRTHSPANEILTAASQAVQHDPKGNTTLLPVSLRPGSNPLSMKWDFNNKLRAADTNNDSTDDVFYLWDALGRRVGRTAGGSTLVYFQVGQQTLADYVAGASASAPASTYLWGSYIDELVLRTSGAGNYYFHRNQQYSIIATTTSAGAIAERYAYTAYGQLTFLNASGTPIVSSAIVNRYTYTGREWDAALALYHYRARMYDPIAGRFVSRDPIGYAAKSFNLMEFVRSNPLGRLDPSGWIVLKDGDDKGNPFGIPLPPIVVDVRDIINDWLRRLDEMTVAEAAAQCNLWIKYDEKLGDDWIKKLKKCPRIKEAATQPDWDPYPGDTQTHPGCAICFRTPYGPRVPTRGGQQCCYDKGGKLITSGTGAGTPDRRHPIIPINPLGHCINDVYPFLVCSKGGLLDKYLERRPPDQGDDGKGNPCPANPTPDPKKAPSRIPPEM